MAFLETTLAPVLLHIVEKGPSLTKSGPMQPLRFPVYCG